SFQLELIDQFRPDISVFLNLTPDHLDRHGSMDAYAAAKARIFENQTERDAAVVNADDAATQPYAPKRAPIYWFSRQREVSQGTELQAGQIVFRREEKTEPVMNRSEIPLVGAHNLENVLAAVAATRLAGAEPAAIAKGVRSFGGVAHRLE